MDRLFASGELSSFGPCALGPLPEAPPFVLVRGQRPAQLRSEVGRFCPRKPGVYGMFDRHGELIYIGKAKSLRGRLLSYFCRRSRGPKAGRILKHTGCIAWETAASEFAALHRELELIRRWRPRLNVQGQPLRRLFAFVCLGRSPSYVFLARRPPEGQWAIFGPIPLGERAREGVRRVNDWFGLRDCPQALEMIFAEDAALFPVPLTAGCLRHELGTCLGPCVAACTRTGYADHVRAARAFLAGTDTSLLQALEQNMTQAAAAQRFERAAVLRDKLEALRWLHDRLERQRQHARESFVYPVRGPAIKYVWYLIHGGRTVASILAPHDQESSRQAAELIHSVYHRKDAQHFLESYEHHDARALVAAWFRRHARERRRVLSPDEALKRCGRYNGAQR